LEERTRLIAYLKERHITAVFHYLSLHLSDYYRKHNEDIPTLPECDRYADTLVRLPMYYELKDEEVKEIIGHILTFYGV
jgi:dTDP-4-amino-4,6-dideoxygalactose transaminase